MILLSLDSVISYFKARCPSLAEYEDKNIPKYHLISKSPLLVPSTSLYSLQEGTMVDSREHLIAWLPMDQHSPDMAVSSFVFASYTTINITDNENFASVLDHHVKVDMTTAVQTAHLSTLQLNLAIDSDTLAWH